MNYMCAHRGEAEDDYWWVSTARIWGPFFVHYVDIWTEFVFLVYLVLRSTI